MNGDTAHLVVSLVCWLYAPSPLPSLSACPLPQGEPCPLCPHGHPWALSGQATFPSLLHEVFI